jgi:hypothetical protein
MHVDIHYSFFINSFSRYLYKEKQYIFMPQYSCLGKIHKTARFFTSYAGKEKSKVDCYFPYDKQRLYRFVLIFVSNKISSIWKKK